MAFTKYTMNKYSETKDPDDNVVAINIVVIIEDDAAPMVNDPITGIPAREKIGLQFTIQGREFNNLPVPAVARRNATNAIIRRKVSKKHARWINTPIAVNPSLPNVLDDTAIIDRLGALEFTSLT